MDKRRIFRALVCFVLICCILVNYSPIRAKATAIGATVVGGTAAAGILGVLFSMAMGVVFVDITADLLTGVGEASKEFIYQYYQDDETSTSTVNSFYDNLSYSFGGSGGDGTGNGDDKMQVLPGVILAGLVAWISSVINDDGFEVEEEVDETAPDGYMYYDNLELPIADDVVFPYSYNCIVQWGGYTYAFSATSPFRASPRTMDSCKENNCGIELLGPCDWQRSKLVDGKWIKRDSDDVGVGITLHHYNASFSWANFDVAASGDSPALSKSEPSSTKTSTQTTTVTPSIYVGDIPTKVQNGDFDDDDLKLPYINYGQVLPGNENYLNELNNLVQQLKEQTKTYEEYLEQLQKQPSDDPDPDPDPDPEPDVTEPPETQPEEGEDEKGLDDFTLDLTDFFPFCLPFDIYEFVSLLAADPVAPCFEFTFDFGEHLGTHTLVIDLSQWDDTAQLLRRLELLLFIIGLAMATRNYYIRG